MKKFIKISGMVIGVVVLLIVVGLLYVRFFFPKVSFSESVKIESAPEKIERGKYLANGFAGCISCHSDRDYSRLYGPVIPGTEGKGGTDFGTPLGFVPASNITPDKETGIGAWSDEEIFKAVTAGIDKNGEPLAPLMPYASFGKLDKEDILSIIAYIKTLQPIKNKIPDKKYNFPFSFLVRTMPTEPHFDKIPNPSDKVALGKYYAAACMSCHTPMDKGEYVKDKLFSGGIEFPNPMGGIIRSANLTSDKETGIGNLTREQFIRKFKDLLAPEKPIIPVKNGEFNTIMPWLEFATMKEDDLGAIYDYLMTVPPLKNKVEKTGIEGLR